MNTQPRLVFFGTEQFSVPTLETLIAHGYNVVGIVTKPDAPQGRGQKMSSHPIKQIGIDHDIPVFQPLKLNSIETELRALNADAAVLVSYGKIISGRILEVFEPIGVINIHPSKLPRFRGPSPIEATIVAGDSSTGISIMRLDEGMDTGPVFAQFTVELTGKETKPELSRRLSELGAEHLTHVLPAILKGQLKAKPQDTTDVSVTSLIAKSDGILDPATEEASVLERKIRAYQGYPKPRLTLHGNDVIVTSAMVVTGPDKSALVVPCANNTFLEILSLTAPSGRSMSGADFLRGYKK